MLLNGCCHGFCFDGLREGPKSMQVKQMGNRWGRWHGVSKSMSKVPSNPDCSRLQSLYSILAAAGLKIKEKMPLVHISTAFVAL